MSHVSLVNKPVIPLQLPVSHQQNVFGDSGVNPITNHGLILKSAGHRVVDFWIWLTGSVLQQQSLEAGVSASEQADVILWPSAGLKSRRNGCCIKPAHPNPVVTSKVLNSHHKIRAPIRCWDQYWHNSYCSPNLNVWGRLCRPTLRSQRWNYNIQTFHLLINACTSNRNLQKDAIKQTKMLGRCCKWSPRISDVVQENEFWVFNQNMAPRENQWRRLDVKSRETHRKHNGFKQNDTPCAILFIVQGQASNEDWFRWNEDQSWQQWSRETVCKYAGWKSI